MLIYYDEELDDFVIYKNSEYLLYISKCIENHYKKYRPFRFVFEQIQRTC